MNPNEAENLGRLRLVIAPIDELKRRVETVTRQSPDPGSPARQDWEHPFGPIVITFAGQAAQIAIDHLIAWHRLIEGARVIPWVAHMTLLRAALESTMFCRWLIDPKKSSAERGRRGAWARVADWEERRKFEDNVNAPPPDPPGKLASARLVEHRRQMKVANIPERRPPPATQLCNDYGPGEWLYRLTSASTHAREWGFVLTKVSHIAEVDVTPGSKAGRGEATTEYAYLATHNVMKYLTLAVNELEAYRRTA